MKLYELFENVNKFDVFSYGHWFDSNTNSLYPVDTAQHGTFAAHKLGNKKLPDIMANAKLMGLGWVRIINNSRNMSTAFNIAGLPQPIKVAWKVLASTILKNFLILRIDLMKPENSEWTIVGDKDYSFDLIKDRAKVISFFNNL